MSFWFGMEATSVYPFPITRKSREELCAALFAMQGSPSKSLSLRLPDEMIDSSLINSSPPRAAVDVEIPPRRLAALALAGVWPDPAVRSSHLVPAGPMVSASYRPDRPDVLRVLASAGSLRHQSTLERQSRGRQGRLRPRVLQQLRVDPHHCGAAPGDGVSRQRDRRRTSPSHSRIHVCHRSD